MIGSFLNTWLSGWRGRALLAIVVVVLLVIPAIAGSDSYLTYLLMTFFIFAMLGHAWNLLAGYCGLLSFGNQVYIGVGGFALAILFYYGGVNVWLALPLAGVASALFAWLLAVPVGERFSGKRVWMPVGVAVLLWIIYELAIAADPTLDVFQGAYVRRVMILFLIFIGAVPLLRLQGAYFAVATWLVAAAVGSVFNEWSVVGAGGGMQIRADYSLELRYYVALGLMALSTLVIWALLRSRYGLALTAVRDNEEAANTVGIDIRSVKALVFVIAGAMTGLAGGLYYIDQIIITPPSAFSITWSAYLVFIVVAGGMGTLAGPIVGAAVFVIVDRILGAYMDQGLLVLGVVAVLIILFLSRGVMGIVNDLRAHARENGGPAAAPTATGKRKNGARAATQAPPGVVAALLVPGSPLPYLRPDNPAWAGLMRGYQQARELVRESDADTLLIYSTQWMAVLDQLWQTRARLMGTHVDENWYEFGDLPFDLKTDVQLAQALVEAGNAAGVRSKGVDYEAFPVDTGSIVANSLLNPDGELSVVLASNNLYHDFAGTERLGEIAAQTAQRLGRRVAVIGVGALSATLYRHDIEIARDRIADASDDMWNRRLLKLIEAGDVAALREMLPEYVRQANGEMGMKHLAWLLGAMGGRFHSARIHAYGPTWGAGAAVVEFQGWGRRG